MKKAIIIIIPIFVLLAAGTIYFFFSSTNDEFCNYKILGLGNCDNKIIKISGNDEKDSFVGQHSVDTIPSFITGDESRENQSYLISKKYGDIKLLNKEKINCPRKTIVIGKLEMDTPCVSDVAKVCDGAPTIVVEQWSCD